jgi:hypothetical protein
MGFTERLKHAWNAFSRPEYEVTSQFSYGTTSFEPRPYQQRTAFSSEKSIINSIFNRIAVDVASIDIRHVRLDENDRFSEEMPSAFNDCLKWEPNVDQSPQSFRQDIVFTMFDKGVAAIVPIDTTLNPDVSGGYDINSMRIGEVLEWYPRHVKVSVWDDRPGKGVRQNIIVAKKNVAIVPNPMYAIMNETNSTLQRLIRKLNLLDVVDDQTSSGKLDMIIQLPYVIKTAQKREQAEQRRKDIEIQLKDSKYGIAYADGTEKITQLNRPAENNLLKQVEFLTEMVYDQLGLTKEIMAGTADEATMLNYINRTVKPILNAIVENMRRSFLTKTARAQRQSILYFRDPFQLVSLENFAELADKLARNEIASSNELRQAIGMKPSKDPKADELRNSNMPAPSEPGQQPVTEGDGQNGRHPSQV